MSAHYVAILDTGGISYSGRTFVAVAATEDEARAVVAGRFLGDRAPIPMPTDVPRTTQGVADYYGIRTYGPIEDGTAVEGD